MHHDKVLGKSTETKIVKKAIVFTVLASILVLGSTIGLFQPAEALHTRTATTTAATTTTKFFAVYAYSLTDGKSISMYTVIRSSDGSVIDIAFTPFVLKGIAGKAYTIEVHDYKDIIFDRWNDGSTDNSKTVTLNDDVSFVAFYKTGTATHQHQPQQQEQKQSQSHQHQQSVGQFLHKLVNEARSKQGLSLLSYDHRLENIAYRHSMDMYSRNYFSHTSPDGKNHVDRIRDAGYTGCYAVGENIAMFKTPSLQNMSNEEIAKRFFDMWWNSPGHKANMLRNYSVEGIGVYLINNSVYATQLLCRG